MPRCDMNPCNDFRHYELSVLGRSAYRQRLGDRHDRHLPRHDLAFRGRRRALPAAGRAQGAARRPARLAGDPARPLEVLPDPDRRVRRGVRRGHLVRHRPGEPGSHQHADPQLRLRLGHRVGLLHGRTDHRGGLLLHVGPGLRTSCTSRSAGSMPWPRSSPWSSSTAS